MEKNQIITIAITAAVTGTITVVVTAFTGWLLALTKALPENEKAIRLKNRLLTKHNALPFLSLLLLGLGIYNLRMLVAVEGPLTRADVLRLIVACWGLSFWFLVFVYSLTGAVYRYLDEKKR